ncbi:4-coumarate--CoA ligase-like 1 [Iris pallida]|uniref:4-coumarate--CoA ligase-like 1 n=1 Tax=Iris pallida TaxID=29817 RepID=A0AAX6FTU7_IRIPA|nr:4-coumarate--CoA ligase-like 1 [Iris pallida]KAJ6835580.1 4-coumarate--CoA ligase-like 1 [Iris pallida]
MFTLSALKFHSLSLLQFFLSSLLLFSFYLP